MKVGARLVQALLGQTSLGAGLVLGLDLSQGWFCFKAGLVSGPDLSQGWTCLRAGLVLTCFRAKLVLTCLRAGLVSGLDLS